MFAAADPQLPQCSFAMAGMGQASTRSNLVQDRSLPGCQRCRKHELQVWRRCTVVRLSSDASLTVDLQTTVELRRLQPCSGAQVRLRCYHFMVCVS